MLPVQQPVENGQLQPPPGGDTAGMTIFKKPAVGLRQRLTFDDFHIIEQVGEGTYGCVPFSSLYPSFYLCIWLFSLFYLYVVVVECGLHTMYIRHRVAQLSRINPPFESRNPSCNNST
jgi:hypothetical protein